jgi:DNA primase
MAGTIEQYDADEVRTRSDIVNVVGQVVTLKKRGSKYSGLCPFHNEKSPSFTVDGDKGFWHCFGCGKGGDVFTFVMQHEHLTFPEALEKLARRSGVRPRVVQLDSRRMEEKDYLYSINAAADDAFRKALRGKAGLNAREYLNKRGITMEHAEKYGLGYAPNGWDFLSNYLIKKSYSEDLLVKANLSNFRTSSSGVIDRFRNRLMVTIYDRQNRIIAFGGRALSPDDQPKYLNTSETPVFTKSRTLYALNFAADTIAKKNRAIVTEGYFDTISCHIAGFTEAVATLGTALGEEHVRILHRLVGENGVIYLVYDADSAGINAALRGQAIFRAAGADVRIAMLPNGHDPDTLIREQGPGAFELALESALQPVAFELLQLLKKFPGNDTNSRLKMFKAAAEVLLPLSDIERAEYAMWLIDRTGGTNQGDLSRQQSAILSEVKNLERTSRSQNNQSQNQNKVVIQEKNETPNERNLLLYIISNVDFAGKVIDNGLSADVFTTPEYIKLFQALVDLKIKGMQPDPRNISNADNELLAIVAELSVRELPAKEDIDPDDLLERLREEYQRRLVTGEKMQNAVELMEKYLHTNESQVPDFNNLDEVREWQEAMRKKAKMTGKKSFGDDDNG